MRLALAGTGSLAQDLLLAVQQTEDVEVTAIYHHSPDPDAARELAERYGIKEVYSDYSRMVRMAKADFVYIALVNDAHFEYAKEALEHGLNVIVEKPMCPTAKEVKLLADMAWERELFLFEAVTTLHTQNYRSLRDMVKQLVQLLAEIEPLRQVLVRAGGSGFFPGAFWRCLARYQCIQYQFCGRSLRCAG